MHDTVNSPRLDQVLAPRTEFVPNKAEISSLTLGNIPELMSHIDSFNKDETLVVVQRNAKDKENRKLSVDSEDFGSLDSGQKEKTEKEVFDSLNNLLKNIPTAEKSLIDIIVVASDASLKMPDNRTNYHQRAMDTAESVVKGLKKSLSENSLNESQLLNPEGKVIPITDLKDLKMLDESPEFVQFLIDKYGEGQQFWENYEADTEKPKRIELNAEGPDEIANRMIYFYSTLELMSKDYHQSHPNRRLVVWSVTHYDSASPFLKQVTGKDTSQYLPVSYGEGAIFKLGSSR